MKIEAYIFTWNNERQIRQAIEWYRNRYHAEIIVMDNYSDDFTQAIAKGMGAFVMQWGRTDGYHELELTEQKNTVWKKSQADWVIICDADELVMFDPKQNATVIKCKGYEMTSERYGAPDEYYDKMSVFNPTAIKESNYSIGCHHAVMSGDVKYGQGILLHYRFTDIEWLLQRYKDLNKRRCQESKDRGWAKHYENPEEVVRAKHRILVDQSVQLL